jgi:hypothetical protein
MRKTLALSALLLGSTFLMASSSEAAPVRRAPHANFHHVIVRHPHRFAVRHDFRHFTPTERRWWSRGHWRHRWWHGRYGWWWNVGGFWYFYDAPVYPYPTVVSSDYYDDEDYDDQDYDNAGPDNDQYGPDQYGPSEDEYDQGGPGVWYHCSKPEGYYPYVRDCSGGWEQVPATPSDMQSAPPGAEDNGMAPGAEDNGPPPPDDQGDDEDDQGPPPPPH